MPGIDLIACGLHLGESRGRERVAIPSALFVRKCEETIAAGLVSHAPL